MKRRVIGAFSVIMFLPVIYVCFLLNYRKHEKKGAAMNNLPKKVYDPHLLYYAINITVELQYQLPMQRVYDVLDMIDDENRLHMMKPDDLIKLFNTLGTNLENKIMDADDDTKVDENTSLQEKIKELLRILGCELTDQELNKILKGELSIEKALSIQAQTAWNMIFRKRDDGRYSPNKEMVDQLLICTQLVAQERVENKIQRYLQNYKIRNENQKNQIDGLLMQNRSVKMLNHQENEREIEDPHVLEQKRNKLRLYIAHMQGYDRDRDRDGGRGVDMTTGYVIDFEDIYIADKEHGSVIQDIDHDGIDIGDIL